MGDEKLADELFSLVEHLQGEAYISDGIGVLSREEVFALARRSLDKHRECAERLDSWLEGYNQLYE